MARLRLRRDAASVLENGDTSGNVLENDSGVDQVTQIKAGSGSYMSVPPGGVTIQGTYGFLTIMPDGSYVYTASTDQAERLKAGATASDTFTYVASGDGSGSTTLKFTVTGVNDAPILSPGSATLNTITEDQITNGGQSVSSFLNSTDVDSSALRGVAITGLASGNGQWQFSTDSRATWTNIGLVSEGAALLLRSSDYIRFVPNGDNGTTGNFIYRAWDQTSGAVGAKVDVTGNGGQTAFSTGTATAFITVTDVNDAPVGLAGSASGIEDGPPITGQVNATDVDSTTLTYALVANSAVGGSVSIDAATGNYSFTPAANFSGTASFKFTASDGSLTSAPATVTIAIAPVNDAPVANADSAGTFADTPVLIDVLANDTDIDGDLLAISALGNASHGTVEIENGKVRYTPAAGYTGDDMFHYTVSDGAGGTAQANVNVTIVPLQPDGTVATSVTFRQDANGYSGTVDTMLRQNRASITFGDAIFHRSILESGKEAQPLLRFDNLFGSGAGQIPIGATIISAALTLEVSDPSASGGSINRMLVGWSSASTWNSMGSGVQINEVEATSTGAISVGSIARGSQTFNVTESLAAWNDAALTSAGQNAANFGWVFKPVNIDSWDFNSAQGAVKPVLSVTYAQAGISPSALPAVSIGAVATANENDGKITFSLSLSEASTRDITVSLGTSDFTAKSGADYIAGTSVITFKPGELTKSFDVSLLNDGTAERPEFFTVQINSATNARIDNAVATGKITDDDVTAPPQPTINASVVAVHNISDATKYDGDPGYGISDPSGLAYIPGSGRLLIADSEHDESPFYSDNNLFSLQLDGSYAGKYSLTSFTEEPTGLAYNPNNGFLYIADDDEQGVFWVSPDNPSVKLGFFATSHLGFLDTEDLKFDPLTGHLHILDGLLKQKVELTDQGVFVNSVSLPSVMKDAEALAYDPRHDIFFVASGASATIWAMDSEANILGTIDVLSPFSPRPKLKGMELAPSSDPNDGNILSLYVTDYGADQKNDGRLFEIHLGDDWWFA